MCAPYLVSVAQVEAEEPDQLKFSAVEILQNPADGRSGSADGVPEFATEQLGGREQDSVPFGLRGLCDLRDRIDTGLMGEKDTGLMGQSDTGLMGQSEAGLKGQSENGLIGQSDSFSFWP